MPHITFRSGPREGERIEIVGEATVGRENADIVIVDEEMSRRHAVLRAQGGALVVEDAGSLNGTWVDGRRIEAPTELADGAEVKMGTTVCLVEVRDSQATRLSAQPAETVEQPSDITIVGKVPTPTPSEQRTDQVTAAVATDEDAAGPATAETATAEVRRPAAADAAPEPAAADVRPEPAAAPPAAPRTAGARAPFAATVGGGRRPRGIATRSIPAAVFVSALVVADAIALVMYFSAR